MKIINLIKSEFIKNYSIKRFLIIFLILVLSSVVLIKINNKEGDYATIKEQLSYYESYQKKPEDIKNFHDEYNAYYNENFVKYLRILDKKGVKNLQDFKVELLHSDLMMLLSKNLVINKLKNNPDDKYIVSACQSDDYEDLNRTEKEIYDLCNNYTSIERDELYKQNTIDINRLESILDKDKYYLYLEYKIEKNDIKEDEFTKLLIDKKLESNLSFIGLNYLQYQALEEKANTEILSKDEYEKYRDGSYENYVDHKTLVKNQAIESRQILLYSSKHEIKHDLNFNPEANIYSNILYTNTKSSVNQVFHLSVIIALIISITSGGIISNEHSRGTIKNIITAPVRRWKILLSKFIYMILDMYILWFLGLIIISIISGVMYGFNDLLTPKLILVNKTVSEINYYLYLIKDILIASIPLICLISILFCLSALTLNTSLTVGVSAVISALGACLWLMSTTGNFKYIVYTPLWYLDCGFIFNNSYLYTESLYNINYTLSTGIIISIIVALVLYIITNIIYIKRDIKN